MPLEELSLYYALPGLVHTTSLLVVLIYKTLTDTGSGTGTAIFAMLCHPEMAFAIFAMLCYTLSCFAISFHSTGRPLLAFQLQRVFGVCPPIFPYHGRVVRGQT